MMIVRLRVFGPNDACQRAKILMEDMPQIKRIDGDFRMLKLFSQERITEKMLIPLLMQSGISGFSILD